MDMRHMPSQRGDLILREMDAGDILPLANIFADERVRRFYSPDLMREAHTEADFRLFARFFVGAAIAARLERSDNFEQNFYRFAIADSAAPKCLIGSVSIGLTSVGRAGETSGRQISFFVDPRFENRGYATRACSLLLDYYFRVTSFDRIYALAHIENGASRRVLEKLGYTETGISSTLFPGERIVSLTLRKEDFYAAIKPFRGRVLDQRLLYAGRRWKTQECDA
jgi:RimJ/RimL family protein N-acetyltransferase